MKMKFTTPVSINKAKFELDYQKKILLLGSCFVDNIGAKLQRALLLSLVNPFGVLYNPLSLASSLRRLMGKDMFEEKDLFKQGSLWSSFSHSSAFSSTSVTETLQNINSRLVAARYFMQEMDVLVITFGTAWIYELKSSREVVSNCHKIPSNQFLRRRLSVEEIVTELNEVFVELKKQNPQLQILLTVSPIRHWKDGAHENTISKSTLHLAVAELQSKLEYVSYFPAFEIMMDELRDYRFYASDMLHPSDDAVQFIWNRFTDSFFSEDTNNLINRIEKLKSSIDHRPLHRETKEYEQFLLHIEETKQKMINEYPFLKQRF